MRLALLDLDGTLCDPREGILKGFAHAFQAVGLPCPEPAAMTAQIGRPLLECFRRLGANGQAPAAARHFQAFFERRGFAEARLFEGVVAMLEGLKADGWRMAIVTAKPAFAGRFVARSLGIEAHFEAIHGCEPEELAPDKGPIVEAALGSARAGRPRSQGEQVFLLGDREQDRAAAEVNGVDFMAAGWGFGADEEHAGAWTVARGPGEVLGHLRERFPSEARR